MVSSSEERLASSRQTNDMDETPSTPVAHAEGGRSVSVSPDALGNVFVTGDHNDVCVTLIIADQRLLARFCSSAPHTGAIANPYRGLDAFYETDSAFSFGRSKLIRRAWVLFQKLQRGQEPRILTAVGTSGSGKSSLGRLRRRRCWGLCLWPAKIDAPGPWTKRKRGR